MRRPEPVPESTAQPVIAAVICNLSSLSFRVQLHSEQYPNKSLAFNMLRHYLLPNQRMFQQNTPV
jgi:hypothetical protein